MSDNKAVVEQRQLVPARHHVKEDVCLVRKPYRDGRRKTGVKVYTVNLESQYLLVQGVPSLVNAKDIVALFSQYGTVESCYEASQYPTEDRFTAAWVLKFAEIQPARVAKKKLDDNSFYGGVLHVCYAPELETVEETRIKLVSRRQAVARRIRWLDRLAQEKSGKTDGSSGKEGDVTTGADPCSLINSDVKDSTDRTNTELDFDVKLPKSVATTYGSEVTTTLNAFTDGITSAFTQTGSTSLTPTNSVPLSPHIPSIPLPPHMQLAPHSVGMQEGHGFMPPPAFPRLPPLVPHMRPPVHRPTRFHRIPTPFFIPRALYRPMLRPHQFSTNFHSPFAPTQCVRSSTPRSNVMRSPISTLVDRRSMEQTVTPLALPEQGHVAADINEGSTKLSKRKAMAALTSEMLVAEKKRKLSD